MTRTFSIVAKKSPTGNSYRLVVIFLTFFGMFFSNRISAQTQCCNILINGDFEQGNTEFTSGLPLNCLCASNSYCVGTNFQVKCGGWHNLTDHTSGSGNFLIVDGSTLNPVDIWKKSSQILSNVTYCFSFWVASEYDSPFDLGVTVDGVLVPGGTFNIQQADPFWTQYSVTFSGIAGNTIAIRQMTGGSQRDFGIDDIEFGAPLAANFAYSPDISCGLLVNFINQSTGPGPLSYSWDFGDPNSGSANFSNQQNPAHKFTDCDDFNVCLTVNRGTCVDVFCQIITAEDVVPPTALCLSVGVVLNANCIATMTPALIDGGSFDDCYLASMSVSPSVISGCGLHPVTLTVTDSCGNSSSCIIDVQAIEDMPPVVICPANVSVNAIPTTCAIQINGLQWLSASDNCGVPTVSYAVTGATQISGSNDISGEVFNQGHSVVTYSADDGCGNIATCSFQVLVTCAAEDCSCSGGSFNANLVANGSFTSGNAGFSSDLAWDNGTGCSTGVYGIYNNFSQFCAGWGPLAAHSVPNFLILDGSNAPGSTVLWQSPVTISPNSCYCFSFWWALGFAHPSQSFPVSIDILDANGNVVANGNIGTQNIANNLTWTNAGFNWNSGSLPAGTYQVAISQLSGSIYRDFGIDDICFSKLPPASVNITGNFSNFTICQGQCITLTASGGGVGYQWNTSAGTQAIQVCPQVTTTYTVTCTDALGCAATASVTVIVHPVPVVNAPDITICFGESTTLTATASGGAPPYTYQWTYQGAQLTISPIITIPTDKITNYTAVVSDAHGCITSEDVVLTLEKCCENNLVQNWDFSSGTPYGFEAIGLFGNVTNWEGIWLPLPPFRRTGDLWGQGGAGTYTSPPGCHVPKNAKDKYAGFFCGTNFSQSKRQGILNNLLGTINPNSGLYNVSMKIACNCYKLHKPTYTVKMAVYGVYSGAISTILPLLPPQPGSLSPLTPLNQQLFAVLTPPFTGAKLLGTIYVPSTCENFYKQYGFQYNSAGQLHPFDRIFLTRSDNLSGYTYLAIDNVCINPTDSPPPTCGCGAVTGAQISQPGSGFSSPISCPSVQPFVIVPPPVQGQNYVVSGDFACNPDGCGDNTVTWTLTGPGGPCSGTSIQLYPFFYITIPSACFPANGGSYTLTITRMCGGMPCSCAMKFIVRPRICQCDNLLPDVQQGFTVSAPTPTLSCVRFLKPAALCPGDIVTWTVSGIGTPFGPSSGNNLQQITFPGPGAYQICMSVRRIVNGMECPIKEICQTVIVECVSPGSPPYVPYCSTNMVKNGDFRDTTIVAGYLGENGVMPEWYFSINAGGGRVIVQDSIGASDEGHLILIGGKNNVAGIIQESILNRDSFIILDYFVKNYLGSEIPAGTSLEIRLQADPILAPGTAYQILHQQEIDTSGGWQRKTAFVQIFPDTTLRYLVINVQNGDSIQRSAIGLDNLEICTSNTPPVGTNEALQYTKVRIFPNPNAGAFNVELPMPASANMTLRIFGLTGLMLKEQPAQAGVSLQKVQSTDLPPGLYFLQIVSEGKTLAVEKFVKQ